MKAFKLGITRVWRFSRTSEETPPIAHIAAPGFAVPHELDLHTCKRQRATLLSSHHRIARAMHAAMTRAWLTGTGPASTQTLSVGIGCRLHTPAADIEAAVRAALGPYAFEQIGTIATIDIKANEAGLLDFCSRHALPLRLFTREQIAAVPTDSSSAAAHAHLGVDGVCEPCALLAAQALERATASRLSAIATIASIARLVVRKTAHAGVTVAIASPGDVANSNAVSTPTAPNDQDLQ